ncbi:MAG: hypothetical protein IKN65_06280 [Clostridia bacterium]|jgi:hypothetical protein|nr:hypothetical protein [Clostridia bacterium]
MNRTYRIDITNYYTDEVLRTDLVETKDLLDYYEFVHGLFKYIQIEIRMRMI